MKPLSPREHDVVSLVSRGLTNKEICAHLFIADATVRNHLLNAREKTGGRNRAHLAYLYGKGEA